MVCYRFFSAATHFGDLETQAFDAGVSGAFGAVLREDGVLDVLRLALEIGKSLLAGANF